MTRPNLIADASADANDERHGVFAGRVRTTITRKAA